MKKTIFSPSPEERERLADQLRAAIASPRGQKILKKAMAEHKKNQRAVQRLVVIDPRDMHERITI